MSLRTYGNKRDASEPAIVKALETLGCSVYRLDRPVDLLLGFRGQTYLAEVKTKGTQYAKKLNKNQQAFADTWRGGDIILLQDQLDVVQFINSLREAA